MANRKCHPESECQNIDEKTKKISIEQVTFSPEITELLRYNGRRDLDPNHVECFLTNQNEVEKDIHAGRCIKLSCQICNISFEGSTSKHKLLEHINLIHSFDIYEKSHKCQFCNGVFYTWKAFVMHKNTYKQESEGCISSTSQTPENLNHVNGEKSGKDQIITEIDVKTNSENITTLQSENLREKCIRKFEAVPTVIKEGSTIRKDVSNNFFKCYICFTKFSKTSEFSSHLTGIHKNDINEKDFDDLSYRCKKCASTFPNLTLLREHFSTKHSSLIIYRCIICHVPLRTKKSLKIHYNNFHVNKNKELQSCNECGKELANLRALQSHIRLKHGQSSNKQGFRCRLCDKKLATKESRKLHYEEAHLGESPFMCGDCGKGFSSKSGLYGHRQLHKTEQLSTCPYCEKIFNRRDSYHEHILIHVGPKHRCPHCPKEFVQRSNLVRHIRIHTGQKPYTCTFCDKRFSDKGACNSHIRVHTREEQCTCPYCGQTFTKKQKLKYHMRKHTGEGLLSCEICSKTFTNAFALKEHRAIHDRQTQAICVECGKAFNTEKYLQRHIALVHQELQNSKVTLHCPVCRKTFFHQARLKSHLVTHLGKKHLRCSICDKRYSTMKSIRNHLQQNHNVKLSQLEFKNCVRSEFEKTQISTSPKQLIEDSRSFKAEGKDVVLSFEVEKESNAMALRPEKTYFENKSGIDDKDIRDTSTSRDLFLNITAPNNHSDNQKVLNYENYKQYCETVLNLHNLNKTDEIQKNDNALPTNEQLNPKQLQSNPSAIINDSIKVDEEPIKSNSQVLQLREKKPEPSLVYSKEISRRRKQLGTPKKYVFPIEELGIIENKLKNVVPKKERVEAIAQSLQKSINLKGISIEEISSSF